MSTKREKVFKRGDILEAIKKFPFARVETEKENKPYDIEEGHTIIVQGSIGGHKYFKEFTPTKEFICEGGIRKEWVRYMKHYFRKIGTAR